ncbi:MULTISPECIES: tyrosine-type recombinase/integrase [Myxococcus]|uniref:tyrosine-type recombinase/integrase n=1 Tax=Myxococcus TaxID=32 RepID=UPI0011450C28|nr:MULTISPECIES: tyrosine-type recombinase/integrase [Myxococcus]NOK05967.1 tyrosine-type recombinase/integrase [Myxococcus xanthus]
MGSIHARGKNTWELVYRGADGKRKWLRTKGTKSKAKDMLRELESQQERIRLGLEVAPQRKTVSTAYASHCEALRMLRSFSTVDGRWRKHLLPELGEKLVHQVTPEDISKVLRAKMPPEDTEGQSREGKRKWLAPKTVRHLRQHLHRFFGWCIDEERLFKGENPVARAFDPDVEDAEPEAMDLALVELVASAAEEYSQDVADLIRTAGYTGLRRGELIALVWECVDLLNRIIRVRASGDSKTTKSKKSRPVPIPLALLPHLERRRRESTSLWVFPAPDGSRNRPDWDANALFRTALRRAGVVDGYAHSCGTPRRVATGERHGRSKLTAPQVKEIRRRAKAGEGPTALSKAYGVSRRTIGFIVSGERWGGAARTEGGCGHSERHPDAEPRGCPACKVPLTVRPIPATYLFKHLRSTYLTHVVEATGDLKVSQDLAGHSSDRVTRKHYAKKRVEHLRAQVDRAFPVPAGTNGTLPGTPNNAPTNRTETNPSQPITTARPA